MHPFLLMMMNSLLCFYIPAIDLLLSSLSQPTYCLIFYTVLIFLCVTRTLPLLTLCSECEHYLSIFSCFLVTCTCLFT